MDPTPEQNAAIQDMESFKEEMKEHGKETEHNLWNATATIFGLILAAISIVATIKKDSNQYVLYATVIISGIGMLCIWRVFSLQREFYSELVRLSNQCIQNHGQDYTEAEKKKCHGLIEKQTFSEKCANWCLLVGIIGLVLMVVL